MMFFREAAATHILRHRSVVEKLGEISKTEIGSHQALISGPASVARAPEGPRRAPGGGKKKGIYLREYTPGNRVPNCV